MFFHAQCCITRVSCVCVRHDLSAVSFYTPPPPPPSGPNFQTPPPFTDARLTRDVTSCLRDRETFLFFSEPTHTHFDGGHIQRERDLCHWKLRIRTRNADTVFLLIGPHIFGQKNPHGNKLAKRKKKKNMVVVDWKQVSRAIFYFFHIAIMILSEGERAKNTRRKRIENERMRERGWKEREEKKKPHSSAQLASFHIRRSSPSSSGHIVAMVWLPIDKQIPIDSTWLKL